MRQLRCYMHCKRYMMQAYASTNNFEHVVNSSRRPGCKRLVTRFNTPIFCAKYTQYSFRHHLLNLLKRSEIHSSVWNLAMSEANAVKWNQFSSLHSAGFSSQLHILHTLPKDSRRSAHANIIFSSYGSLHCLARVSVSFRPAWYCCALTHCVLLSMHVPCQEQLPCFAMCTRCVTLFSMFFSGHVLSASHTGVHNRFDCSSSPVSYVRLPFSQ